VVGEEGVSGAANADWRWVVDPIDGTVNFTYGIPHACISIALQAAIPSLNLNPNRNLNLNPYPDGYVTLVGIVYDPFCNELWTAIRGGPARLNGRIIHVSRRQKLNESIVAIGFAKSRQSIEDTLP